MISNRPNEDADNLNDDHLLTTYFDGGSAKPDYDAAADIADWPPLATQGLGLSVDAVTRRWFETNYGDWRQGMCAVLRAWADIQTRGVTGLATPAEPQQPD